MTDRIWQEWLFKEVGIALKSKMVNAVLDMLNCRCLKDIKMEISGRHSCRGLELRRKNLWT